jgi:hypothetical protein
VWSGTRWSNLTRPYGEPVAPTSLATSLATSLEAVRALHRLVRYGVVAVFAGLGLVVSVLAHWPGTAHPMGEPLAAILSDTGVALFAIGTACYAFALRALKGRWTFAAFIPGVNVVVLSGLMTQRVGGRSPLVRVTSEIILLALFVAQSHAQVWLGVAPALVALDHARWSDALATRLSGPTLTSRVGP